MKKLIYSHKADFLLFFTFLLFVAIIKYCYPVAEITWDSDSYIQYSQNPVPNIRPIGYSVFLWVLYHFSHSLSFVVYCQFFIYFFSVLCLLKVVNRYCRFSFPCYYFLGVLLLAEPAALYNCITILSDILFASLTYLYLSALLLYMGNKKRSLLIAHIILMVLCIAVRHIALFFPFFTIFVFIVYTKNIRSVVINSCLVLLAFSCIYFGTIAWNNKIYGVPVYSPFSGWTQANNVLYVLPEIKLDPSTIPDREIRRLHTFFTAYLDTTSFRPGPGTGYLWDGRSPLNVLRKRVDDSLAGKTGHGDYTLTWYLQAPEYAKYGSYIEMRFPYQYFRLFMLPNISSLIQPHDGEMMDYYTAKNEISPASLQMYGLTAGMLYCRVQLYKYYVNAINLFLYQVRLVLFLLAVLGLFISRRKYNADTIRMASVLCAFVLLFYFAMLSSSWFMPRYLLPVLPVLTIIIFTVMVNWANKPQAQ